MGTWATFRHQLAEVGRWKLRSKCVASSVDWGPSDIDETVKTTQPRFLEKSSVWLDFTGTSSPDSKCSVWGLGSVPVTGCGPLDLHELEVAVLAAEHVTRAVLVLAARAQADVLHAVDVERQAERRTAVPTRDEREDGCGKDGTAERKT